MPYGSVALAAIKAEVLNDPTGQGYAGRSSADQCRLLNNPLSQSPVVNVSSQVSIQDVAKFLVKRGRWEAIKTAATTPVASGHADAFNLYELVHLPNMSQDNFSVGELKALIDHLVTAGLLTAADLSALANIIVTEVKKSRAEVILGGGVMVDEGDVRAALGS